MKQVLRFESHNVNLPQTSMLHHMDYKTKTCLYEANVEKLRILFRRGVLDTTLL